MNKQQNFRDMQAPRNNWKAVFTSFLFYFFSIIWVASLVLWLIFIMKGMIAEMWVANAGFWVGWVGHILVKKD